MFKETESKVKLQLHDALSFTFPFKIHVFKKMWSCPWVLGKTKQSIWALKRRQQSAIHVTVSRSTASMSDFSPLAQHDLSKTLHKRILMTNTQFDIYQSQLAVEYLRGT